MAEAFGMVKVGNREWLFLKATPLSRTAAMAGAVCALTIWARRPSGMKSTTLCVTGAIRAPAVAAKVATRATAASPTSRLISRPPRSAVWDDITVWNDTKGGPAILARMRLRDHDRAVKMTLRRRLAAACQASLFFRPPTPH